jgi:eukaryotic translation initiation factor 2C
MKSGGKVPMNDPCIEAITFLDHLMREGPSQRYTALKRSFFPHGQQRVPLGGGIEALKGVFASMRMVNLDGTGRLAVNLDVANGTFWVAQKLLDAVWQSCKFRNVAELQHAFDRARGNWDASPLKRDLKRFRHVTVYSTHRGTKDVFKIDKFIPRDATEHKFEIEVRDQQGAVTSKRWVTVAEYFLRKYNVRVERNIPLVKTTKGKGWSSVPIMYWHHADNSRR